MAITFNADTTNGAVITSDTSGEIELQANGVTKAKVTANGLQDANGNSLRGGMYRNLLINGDFNVWQRGTSFSPTSALYGADRFQSLAGGGFNIDSTVTQSTDVPTGQGFKYSLDIAVDTVQTPTGSNNGGFGQFCETQNFYHLAWGTSNAKSLTLSFWVKSNKTGTYVCQFKQNESGTDYYILKEYTINTADTWEKKIITIDGNTSQNFDGTANGDGFRMIWWLASGPDDYETKDVWIAGGGYKATSNQVNLWDNAANYWRITGTQLEVGEGASDFEFLPYDVQLQRCQRYYYATSSAFIAASATTLCYNLQFPVTMRAIPTETHSYAGVANDVYAIATAATPTFVPNGNFVLNTGIKVAYDFDAGLTAGQAYQTEWTFSAEI
jgi:hypothetical protein